MATGNQRPGVYSTYSVTSRYAAPRSALNAALIAAAPGVPAGLSVFESYGEAAALLALPEQRQVLCAARILFESGVSRVYFSPVTSGYSGAASHVAELSDIGIVITDAEDEDDLYDLLDQVCEASEALRESLLFAGAAPGGAVAAARALNHERAVLCSPACRAAGDDTPRALYTAAALAGAVLAANDPAGGFTAMPLETLYGAEVIPEAQVQAMIAAGVCVFEETGGAVECVRAVTTRTLPDLSLRPLGCILIIDDVMRSVRAGLKSLLGGLRAGAHSYGSIASQITVILSAKRDEGIIESFMAPVVRADKEDPAACVAEISFGVAHIVEQIHLSAHIRV